MILTIRTITLVDLEHQLARKVSFAAGHNFITSENNHLGKSSLIKSIYYTLGAEVYFSKPWRDINFFSYIAFDLDEKQFVISRYNNSFCIYQNGRLHKQFRSVTDFGQELADIFNLQIELVSKDDQGTVVLAPPAFYYLPYYIDQENGWSGNSNSFNRMTQFDLPQRKDVYMFQLGVLDGNFTILQKQKKAAEIMINESKEEIEKLTTIINALNQGFSDIHSAFDLEALEKIIEEKKLEQGKILEAIQKKRNEIMAIESTIINLEKEKSIISKYIKGKTIPITETISKITECPHCGWQFEVPLVSKLEKTYLQISLNEDYGKIVAELNREEMRLSREKLKFTTLQNKLVEYEERLAKQNNAYQSYMKNIATHQMISKLTKDIGAHEVSLLQQDKLLRIAREKLSGYAKSRNEVIERYNEYLEKLLLIMSVPKEQTDAGQEPGAVILASGAYGPRCKIAQILAFVQTQRDFADENIKLPIIIDSPNTLEQDARHLAEVMNLLLNWKETQNQVIISSINGREIATNIEGVNVIQLENKENQLLQENEYQLYEKEIVKMFMNH